MKKNRSVTYCFTLAFIILVSLGFNSKNTAQQISGVEIADTTSFTPNTAGGWSILSTYFNQDTPDSVEFELILKRTNSTNWRSEQFMGTITNRAFLPLRDQDLVFYLMPNNKWRMRILTNGQCFFYLMDGLTPAGSLVALPIKVRYKNK